MSAGLAALREQLQRSQHPRERAELAGKLLAACGHGLRGAGEPGEEHLKAVGPAEVEGWLAVVDTEAIRGDLARAAEAAIEACLAEGDAERQEWEGWAMEALGSRDALDAALVALEKWEALHGGLTELARRTRERLARELAKVDAGAAAISRRLVGINTARRTARDRLAGDHRARAWWYSARAECDALAALWREQQTPSPENAHCGECARDRANAKLAEKPPGRCVSGDELWSLDLGELPPARRRLVEKHARDCGECALALQALAVSLLEAGALDAGQPSASGGAPLSARPEVVASHPEFQVLLFRERRARLVIAPVRQAQLGAAAVQLSRAAARLDGMPTVGGLEIDLGPLEKLEGNPARLTVKLAGGRSVNLDLEL